MLEFWLEIDPENTVPNYLLGEQLLREGDADAVFRHLVAGVL